MNLKKLFVLSMLFVPVLVSAQTAAEFETILKTPAVSYGQASLFVNACATDTGSADVRTAAEAYALTKDRGWLPSGTAVDAPVTMKDISFLMMNAFGIKGGIMYNLFPGPRYAYRTMVSRRYISGICDPDMKVSGEQFFVILGNVLSETGGEQ